MAFQLFNIIGSNKDQKDRLSAQKRQLSAAHRAAQRRRKTVEEQAPLIPRRAEESLAARGVADSSFAKTQTQRADNLAQREIANARDAESVARKNLRTFKKLRKRQRQKFYAALAADILSTALAVTAVAAPAAAPLAVLGTGLGEFAGQQSSSAASEAAGVGGGQNQSRRVVQGNQFQ